MGILLINMVDMECGWFEVRVFVVVCEVIVSYNGLILSFLFYVIRIICNVDCVLVKKGVVCVFKSE